MTGRTYGWASPKGKEWLQSHSKGHKLAERIPFKCEICGSEFGVLPSWVRVMTKRSSTGKPRFCSRECRREWMVSGKKTAEMRQRRGEKTPWQSKKG